MKSELYTTTLLAVILRGFSNQVDSEIHKAERHVTRIMLDCYKCLNLSLHDEVLLFERPMQVLLWILSAIASGVISIILAKYL